MLLLGLIGMVDATVDVSICDITMFIGFPKRAFTREGSTELVKFGSPTSEKVVSFGFVTSRRFKGSQWLVHLKFISNEAFKTSFQDLFSFYGFP